MRTLKPILLTALLLCLLDLPAMARRSGGGWHHGHRGGPRWSVGVGFPLFVGPSYFGPAYYSAQPVVVGRMVGTGSIVMDAQQALAAKGYTPGPIDGVMGPRTRAALRTFQTNSGLPVTGELDGLTLRALALL